MNQEEAKQIIRDVIFRDEDLIFHEPSPPVGGEWIRKVSHRRHKLLVGIGADPIRQVALVKAYNDLQEKVKTG